MEKYEEALERAKQGLPIDEVFPELKESEDERIRNEILLYIGSKQDIDLDTHNRWCAYLEKHKEQKSAEWSEEDENCLNYALWCVMKTRHFAAKDACDLDACWYAERWLESFPERFNLKLKQEWSEEDENTLECSDPFKRFVDMVHSVDKGEFTEFEYSIINFVLACCDKNIAMTPKGIHCYAKTILNIVKKEFTPKNCGWTDEEETVLHNACEFIRHRLNDSVCRNGNIGGMDYNILYEKLKSIRPQPNWKPSEKQMEALEHFIRSWGESGTMSPQNPILCDAKSLLNELKKL